MAKLVTTQTFADGDQVTSAKLNAIISGASFSVDAPANTTLTVTGGKLKVGTITSSEMGALSVGNSALQSNSVTTAKIEDGNVTTAKLADLSITSGKIANGAVTFGRIASSAIAEKVNMESQSDSYIVSPAVVKYAPMSAKAYAEVAIEDTGRAIANRAYNVDGAARVSSTATQISLDGNMDSATYTVVATLVGSGATAASGNVTVYNKTASSFRLSHPSEAAGLAINFVVYGKLNS